MDVPRPTQRRDRRRWKKPVSVWWKFLCPSTIDSSLAINLVVWSYSRGPVHFGAVTTQTQGLKGRVINVPGSEGAEGRVVEVVRPVTVSKRKIRSTCVVFTVERD